MVKLFQEVTSSIKKAITKTQLDANKKLVNFYYNIGRPLEEKSS